MFADAATVAMFPLMVTVPSGPSVNWLAALGRLDRAGRDEVLEAQRLAGDDVVVSTIPSGVRGGQDASRWPGIAANASLLGANTVKGPSPFSVSTNPAAWTTAVKSREVGIVRRRRGDGIVRHTRQTNLRLREGWTRRTGLAGRRSTTPRWWCSAPLVVVVLPSSPPVPASERLGAATTPTASSIASERPCLSPCSHVAPS